MSIPLNKHEINKISYILHQLHTSRDDKQFDEMINYYHIDTLIDTKHNGLITNLVIYLIRNNIKLLEDILIKIESFDDFKLMKRDYLQIIKYYYPINELRAIDIFVKTVLNGDINLLQSKDIDFIIENKLFKLLLNLDGLFINISKHWESTCLPLTKLKLYAILEDIANNILTLLEHEITTLHKNTLDAFSICNNTFDVIIDGGNVIYNFNGKYCDQSLYELEHIFKKIKEQFTSPLIVLHKKHIKIFPQLITLFKIYKIKYFLTPYNINDDLFILWFLLKNNNAFIISNDKFRDHIFKFDTNKQKYNFELGLCQFKNIIKQQTLGYNIINNICHIDPVPIYSNCIHITETHIYLPSPDGKFMEISVIDPI